MRYGLRIGFVLILTSVLILFSRAQANLAVDNTSATEKSIFDDGTLTALGILREELGKEQDTWSLDEAGIRTYLVSNGIDVNKFSLDVEAYLGQVVLYAIRGSDGFWDGYVWSNIDEKKMLGLQKRLLLSYDTINNLCEKNLYMVFGFSNNINDNAYSIESSENAKQLYQLTFERKENELHQAIKELGVSQKEEEALICFSLLTSYAYLPSSAKPIQSYSATLDNPDYTLYMLDVSSSENYDGKNLNTYFIVYDNNSQGISAISFDKSVTQFQAISDKNAVYAKYLTLNDGIGDFVTNQLSMDKRVFGAYLKAFYDVYYK